jgi:uncharacterized membrane protein HdeD (DUF308 family)
MSRDYPPADRYRDRPDEGRRSRDYDDRGRDYDDRYDDDYSEDRFRRDQPFPSVVTFAGICWIVFGGLILCNLALLFFLMSQAAPGPERGAAMVGGVCGGAFIGLFGGGFIFVGVQSIQGSAVDTLGNGIGSIIFSALVMISGAAQLANNLVIQAGVSFLFGAGLLAAGILALVGRTDYKRWRRFQKERRRYRDD